MKFAELATYFEKIEAVSSRLTITSLLAELFQKLTPLELEKTVYLLQGRVVPAFQAIEFGMAEKTVIKAIVSALNMEKTYFDRKARRWGIWGKQLSFSKSNFYLLKQKI